MVDINYHKDNHFVPRIYLKSWESSHKKLWVYRTLVSHQKVPYWKESSISGVAYHSNLYARIVSGVESDEVERWFDEKFEAPAKEPIQKVISGTKLTRYDWHKLIRFLAAQDVRTPKRLLEGIKRWNRTLPDILNSTLREAVTTLKEGRIGDDKSAKVNRVESEYLPLRIKTEIEPGEDVGILKAETVIGRGTWLFSIHHLLNSTANILHKHKWTILLPPKELSWFTTDCPVVRLNFHSPRKYDFDGGWGSKGTEIFLPLSPPNIFFILR